MSEVKESSRSYEQPLLKSFILEGTCAEIVERYASLYERAQNSAYGEFDSNVVVLDTETTGFSFNHDELTQIAAARVEEGRIAEWFVTFVNPGKEIPEEVAHLTNIHDADVVDAPTPQEALAKLVEFVGDAKIVAHNVGFDRGFTTKHPEGYPLLENVWIDSLDLSRIALPRMKSHRLIDLVKAFGGPLSTHRADDDVTATCSLFRILLAAVDAMPHELVRKIVSLATQDDWPTVVVFRYFAQRHEEEERVAARLAGCDAADYKPTSFSIRSLRRARLSGEEGVSRKDAAHIAENSAAHGTAGLVFPSEEEVASAFSPQGIVAFMYDDYETRNEQVSMALAVRDAFEKSRNLVVEAGTGVGKSMAYLLPAALTAQKNGITVGIATKTNTLLDQLVYHELPALSDAMARWADEGGEGKAEEAKGAKGIEGSTCPRALKYASLKGFSHYPCLKKVERMASEPLPLEEIGPTTYSPAPALAALLSWVEQTAFDDMDTLKIDYRVLGRRSITTTSHDCLRRKCPYFSTSCFVHGSRRKAQEADVVVTNHSLLFCDLVAEGGLLPPIRYWVVDEAHNAEAEARNAFSVTLSGEDIKRLARRAAPDGTSRDPFTRAGGSVSGSELQGGETLAYTLASKAHEAAGAFKEAADELVAHFDDLLYFDTTATGKRSKAYDYVDLWINEEIRRSSRFCAIAGLGKTMVEKAEKLVTLCQELVGYLEDVSGAADVQREIASIAMELKDIVRACQIILFNGKDEYAYAARLYRNTERGTSSLSALMYNVGHAMEETLYASAHSVVFTSATITVDHSFDSFTNALGLNTCSSARADTVLLESSYDYDTNMVVYVANDIPEPSDPGYLPELKKLLAQVHIAQHGSMLTLFTNKREMEQCFEEVQLALKPHDLRLVCQKWGVSVKGLRDDFLADESLSLFATKSFWEGFDAPGATLKGVVIPKLPFARPTDPLSCERAAREDRAWLTYTLPAAILETKQAAGRLIRKATDTGVLVFADRRLVSKRYGKEFLASLPSSNIHVCSSREIVEEIERRSCMP